MNDDAVLRNWLQLNLVPGLGPRILQLLLQRFHTPEAILAASAEELMAVEHVGRKLAVAIRDPHHAEAAADELARCRDGGIDLVLKGDEAYPALLKEIIDPPPVLYVRGELTPADRLAVAIVGSRSGTLYGRQQAERFAAALSRAGMTVISGLARGIDAAAHRGALEAEGRTIAVTATGHHRLYPPEHADLAARIIRQGAVVTESPLDRGPTRGLFPQRNRIIAGMALGVIIIEAGHKSGALHTARHAMEQGREVFALPGRVTDPSSAGCHDLIRDGAILLRRPEDVLDALGPLMSPVALPDGTHVRTPRELKLSDLERAVLELIPVEPVPIDQVLDQAELDASRVLATLTVLEMRQLVRRAPGGCIVRV